MSLLHEYWHAFGSKNDEPTIRDLTAFYADYGAAGALTGQAGCNHEWRYRLVARSSKGLCSRSHLVALVSAVYFEIIYSVFGPS